MTVARDRLIEFWPLVDVGKLSLGEGDVVVLRLIKDDPALQQRLAEAVLAAFPRRPVLIVQPGSAEFVVHRAAREMRAEDLDVPRRRTTME